MPRVWDITWVKITITCKISSKDRAGHFALRIAKEVGEGK